LRDICIEGIFYKKMKAIENFETLKEEARRLGGRL
jgi:hypothetical protein